MVYRNLECSNEKEYRWHIVEDIRQTNNAIFQSVIKQVKEDISSILIQIGGTDPETIAEILEKYTPPITGGQTILCPSCKHMQTDVIINDQTKLREDLWRSYEADRFIKQFLGVS